MRTTTITVPIPDGWEPDDYRLAVSVHVMRGRDHRMDSPPVEGSEALATALGVGQIARTLGMGDAKPFHHVTFRYLYATESARTAEGVPVDYSIFYGRAKDDAGPKPFVEGEHDNPANDASPELLP